MNKFKISVISLSFFILGFLFLSQGTNAVAKGGNGKKTPSPSSVQNESNVLLDVNNIATYIRNNGIQFEDPYTNNKAGFYWPKPPQSVLNNPPIPQTYSTANFAGGVWLSANYGANTSDKRTACVYYTTEYDFGKWTPNGGPADLNDSTTASGKQRFRVYKVTQGDTTSSATNYADYSEWPFADGAPYLAYLDPTGKDFLVGAPTTDTTIINWVGNATIPTWLYGKPLPAGRNGKPLLTLSALVNKYSSFSALAKATTFNADGSSTPLLTPKIEGDQALWCVYRDLDPKVVTSDAARYFEGPAMHAEVQQYVFGFNSSSDVLGNIFFMDFKIINRSSAVWDSTFVAFWDDIDDGNGGTDLMGSYPFLNLAYNYKPTNNDGGQPFAYGVDPPAVGASFFQGPFVKGGGPTGGDTTLGVSSMVRFINGVTGEGDPTNVQQVAYALRGDGQTGGAYTGLDPTGHFEFTGDPETGTGTLDTYVNDKRFLIVTGSNEGYPKGTPNSHGINYKMNPGDTAEVVVALLVARGSNNLNSVTKLKKVALSAQAVFGANFQLPKAPPPPLVTATQLPNQIILNWDNARTSQIENYTTADFATAKAEQHPFSPDYYGFINYNVYQYSSSSAVAGGSGTKVKIATFTVPGQPTTLVDTLQNSDGFAIPYKIYPGYVNYPNIERTFSIKRDYLSTSADTTLKNGKIYYFGVTASAYNPKAWFVATSQTVLESSISQLVVAIPQSPLPGTVLSNNTGDLVSNFPRYKLGDQNVAVSVVDPTLLTGHSYRIKVDTTSSLKWSLFDLTANDTLVTKYSGVAISAPIKDGFKPYVIQQPLGVKTDAQNGTQYLPIADQHLFAKSSSYSETPVNEADASRFPSNIFGGGIAYPAVSLYSGNAPGTTVPINKLKKVKIVFSSQADTAHQQYAYRYLRNVTGFNRIVGYVDTTLSPSGLTALVKNRTDGGYQDKVLVPFKVYEVDPFDSAGTQPRQLNVLFTEYNDSAYAAVPNGSGGNYHGSFIGKGAIDGHWNPTAYVSGGSELLYIMNSTYGQEDSTLYKTKSLKSAQNLFDISYILWLRADSSKGFSEPYPPFTEGDSLVISPNYPLDPTVNYDFATTAVVTGNIAAAKSEVNKINVFPNPYLGTHGPRGTLEKDVAFSIVKKLGRLLRDNFPSMKIVYTRDTDVKIPLDERGKIANRAKAKLFVSVHCNANPNRDQNGVETYFLGLHKTDAALDVAKRENAVIQNEDDYQNRYQDFTDENVIMITLAQSAFSQQSQKLAELVNKNITVRTDEAGRGVKQAGFMVLWTPSMPSILVESGFLTNAEEERFLASDKGQQKIAEAIFAAIKKYKSEYESQP